MLILSLWNGVIQLTEWQVNLLVSITTNQQTFLLQTRFEYD